MNLTKDIQTFLKTAQKPLLVIIGPTSSGKTALSLKLAKKIQGEIISTDSRQIYQGMEISTEAITSDQQQGIPHHLLSTTPPDKTVTLAQYTDLARKTIQQIHKRKKLPILVGGTGLYISGIIEGYEVPRIPPNEKLRKKLEKEAKEKGHEHLHKKLTKLDPEAAKKIHPNNLRYVIRALEINLAGNQNKEDKKKKKSPFDVMMIGIKWPRQQLYEKINARVDSQVKRGLIDEVKKLLDQYPEDLPAMSSLGVKEIVPHVREEMPLEQCLEILKRNTRRYAKRQMTWFRRYRNVNWLNHLDLQNFLGDDRKFTKSAKPPKVKLIAKAKPAKAKPMKPKVKKSTKKQKSIKSIKSAKSAKTRKSIKFSKLAKKFPKSTKTKKSKLSKKRKK